MFLLELGKAQAPAGRPHADLAGGTPGFGLRVGCDFDGLHGAGRKHRRAGGDHQGLQEHPRLL